MQTENLGSVDHEQYLTAVIAVHDDGRQRIICLAEDWSETIDAKCIQAQAELAAMRTAMAEGAQGAGRLEADLTQQITSLRNANELLVNQLAQARAGYNDRVRDLQQAQAQLEGQREALQHAHETIAHERAARSSAESQIDCYQAELSEERITRHRAEQALAMNIMPDQSQQVSGNHVGQTSSKPLRKRKAPEADE